MTGFPKDEIRLFDCYDERSKKATERHATSPSRAFLIYIALAFTCIALLSNLLQGSTLSLYACDTETAQEENTTKSATRTGDDAPRSWTGALVQDLIIANFNRSAALKIGFAHGLISHPSKEKDGLQHAALSKSTALLRASIPFLCTIRECTGGCAKTKASSRSQRSCCMSSPNNVEILCWVHTC
jgi:hypothetical protein